MKRVKEIVLYGFVIILICLCFLRLFRFHFSPEEAFNGLLRGRQVEEYGEILFNEEVEPNIYQIVGVSANGNRFLSGTVRNVGGVLWRGMENNSLDDSGGPVFYTGRTDYPLDVFRPSAAFVAGISRDATVKEVMIAIMFLDEELVDLNLYREYVVPVDENGFFYLYPEEEEGVEWLFDIRYMEGRDAEGVVVQREGIAPDGTRYGSSVLDETQ